MWIRSQDGKVLGCFKAITVNGSEIYGLIDGSENGLGKLGRYKTEEMAVEILNDIHTHIDIIEKAKLGIVKCDINDSIVYRMPKE